MGFKYTNDIMNIITPTKKTETRVKRNYDKWFRVSRLKVRILLKGSLVNFSEAGGGYSLISVWPMLVCLCGKEQRTRTGFEPQTPR